MRILPLVLNGVKVFSSFPLDQVGCYVPFGYPPPPTPPLPLRLFPFTHFHPSPHPFFSTRLSYSVSDAFIITCFFFLTDSNKGVGCFYSSRSTRDAGSSSLGQSTGCRYKKSECSLMHNIIIKCTFRISSNRMTHCPYNCMK